MNKIPYIKAHGAKNDFLLSWARHVPPGVDRSRLAIAICDRHTGVGADGWMVVDPPGPASEARISLINSDGSACEMSGNGTRCVAALLVDAGLARDELRIETGAGSKQLRLIERRGLSFEFDMNMGRPAYNQDVLRFPLQVEGCEFDATILNVGNPQCVIFVKDFDLNWRRIGKAVEHHPMFPARTNVSFVVPRAPDAIDVRFWERGAGETMSSGTGSTGAAFASILRGLIQAPARVLTPAGELAFRIVDGDAYLTGPAELIAAGEFYFEEIVQA